MKRGRWILLALVVVLAFPVSLHAKDAGPAAVAKAKFTTFTGTETFLELAYPGDWTFTPGGALHIRDGEYKAFHNTTDPRVTGVATIVANCNVSPDDRGEHCWGTILVEPCDDEFVECDDQPDGAWEAIWHSPEGRPEITAVGHGTGAFEGLKAWWTFDYDGNMSGRILDPHGK